MSTSQFCHRQQSVPTCGTSVSLPSSCDPTVLLVSRPYSDSALTSLIFCSPVLCCGTLIYTRMHPRVYLAFNQKVPGTWQSCPVIIQSDELFAREHDICRMSVVIDVWVPPHHQWL